jgi:YaiO family outer membrane protein
MVPIRNKTAARLRAALAGAALAVAPAARAQVPAVETPPVAMPEAAPSPAKTEVEIGTMPQWLTNGRGIWREYYVDMLHRYGERNVVYGALRETQRFGQNDTQGVLGTYYALTRQLTAFLEASGSPTHNVLPNYTVAGQLGYNWSNGWGVYAGMRHTDYTSTLVNTSTLLIERYFGNFRAAYAWNQSWLPGAGSSAMHAVTLNYYYGDNSQASIALANGREVENVGPPTGVVSSGVTSASVNGRHWFTRDYALSYEVFYQNQPAFYAQAGVRLGLRFRF